MKFPKINVPMSLKLYSINKIEVEKVQWTIGKWKPLIGSIVDSFHRI